MTFSIVARSADGSSWGVAVASKFLAVGAVVPAAQAGVGALATQAFANLSYRPEGLALLRAGSGASDTLESLVAADDGRAERQAGIVDVAGDSATYTGVECMTWAGGRAGPGYAIQGNILAGPQVVDEMAGAWLAASAEMPFGRRLHAALAAGDAAGGDRRGRQSAALLVVTAGGGYGGGSDVLADLRVDDHRDPVAELGRLLDLHELYFGRADPATLLPLEGALLAEVRGLLAGLGHRPADDAPQATRDALWEWAGIANLEERVTQQPAIDPVVLAVLREQAGAVS